MAFEPPQLSMLIKSWAAAGRRFHTEPAATAQLNVPVLLNLHFMGIVMQAIKNP